MAGADDPFDELEEDARLQDAGLKAVLFSNDHSVYVFVSACVVWEEFHVRRRPL